MYGGDFSSLSVSVSSWPVSPSILEACESCAEDILASKTAESFSEVISARG